MYALKSFEIHHMYSKGLDTVMRKDQFWLYFYTINCTRYGKYFNKNMNCLLFIIIQLSVIITFKYAF